MLAIIAGMALLLTTACKKDKAAEPAQISLELPTEITMAYGEVKEISLPENLMSQSDISFQIGFSDTQNIQVSSQSKLYDKLGQAVTIDRKQKKMFIDSRLLYPNGAVSSASGVQVPDTYKINVVATTSQGKTVGNQTFPLKVTQAKLSVKSVGNQNNIPFAYVLYSDKGASFEMEATALSTEGSTWYLPVVKGAESTVSMDGNQIKFKATEGDPAQKAEQAYELEPALQKDGFTVASTKFRVLFIPQIKFFYGTYYPEYNLTILTNLLHISPSNGYVSAAPTLYPEKYKSTFSITSIQKDGQAFDNTDGIFVINAQTGSVTVKQNTRLTAGSYKLIVKAITTTGLEFSTDLTLAMEAG